MNAEHRFEIEVFNVTFDTVVMKLQRRFESLNEIAGGFAGLHPTTLQRATDEELNEVAERLYNEYQSDLSSSFSAQLLSFRASLRPEIAKLSTISEVAELLIIQNDSLISAFPDIYTALLLFLTLPVSVATSERSFSKLKLIKNYLRSTMTQERL